MKGYKSMFSDCNCDVACEGIDGRWNCLLDPSIEAPPPAATGGESEPRTEVLNPEQEYLALEVQRVRRVFLSDAHVIYLLLCGFFLRRFHVLFCDGSDTGCGPKLGDLFPSARWPITSLLTLLKLPL